MTWFYLSLSATICWALVNTLDKRLLDQQKLYNSTTLLILNSLIGLIPALFLYEPVLSSSFIYIFVVIISGLLDSLFLILYYKALIKSNVSYVSITFQLIPIFTVLIGLIVFGEHFSPIVYLGIFCVILGLLIASQIEKINLQSSKNVLSLMVPATLFASVSYALRYFALKSISVNSTFFWGRIGQLLFSLIVFILSSKVRKGIKYFISNPKLNIILIVALIETLNLIGIYLINKSYEVGPLSLIATISSTQPIFVILFSDLIVHFFPVNIMPCRKIKISIYQLVGSILVIIGVYFISI